jgi:muramoyltetrapeptide carboxypeptidase
LAGTRYWVDPTDKILFLDHPEGEIFGTGFPLSWLDSFLADLDNMGVFRQIKGLVIGRAYNLSPEQILQLKQMVLNYTSGFDYPVLYDFNIGHTDPIITLPLGVMVRMDSFNNTFEILESGVS